MSRVLGFIAVLAAYVFLFLIMIGVVHASEQTELACLTKNVYHEARGESISGQLAVAFVTLNRAKERGTTVCREVYRPGQFSWTAAGDPPMREKGAAKQALVVAKWAMQGRIVDPTDGARWYHATYVKPKWRRGLVRVDAIGDHVFYKAPTVVTYYWATWCAPCHRVRPMVERWAADHPEVRLVAVDYDSAQGKRDRQAYRLSGVPDLRIDDRVYSPDWIGGYAADYLNEFLKGDQT